VVELTGKAASLSTT